MYSLSLTVLPDQISIVFVIWFFSGCIHAHCLLTSSIGVNNTTHKHASENSLLPSEEALAREYGTVIHHRLFKEYDKLLKAGAPTSEIEEAKKKSNEQAKMNKLMFDNKWTPFMEFDRDEEEKILAEGVSHYQKQQQISMAKQAYVDFSHNTLGIVRMHPNFDSHQWAPPYGFNTTRSDAIEHTCRVELKDKLRDDEYLRLSLERGVNASQIHNCKQGYCLKTKRVRINQKKKAQEAAQAKEKIVDTLPPIPVEEEEEGPEVAVPPSGGKDKAAAEKNEKFDKLGRKKPKYELQRICRFDFPKDYDGFKDHVLIDEAGKPYLDRVERQYYDDKTPVMADGGTLKISEGKVATPRNHQRVNRFCPELLLAWNANTDTVSAKVFQYIEDIANYHWIPIYLHF